MTIITSITTPPTAELAGSAADLIFEQVDFTLASIPNAD